MRYNEGFVGTGLSEGGQVLEDAGYEETIVSEIERTTDGTVRD
jgi:hypothetical protein